MKLILSVTLLCLWLCMPLFGQDCFTCADTLVGTIFCDDFESTAPLSDRYFEYGDANGGFVPVDGVGRDESRGMRAIWQTGQVSAGSFKKSLGRTPDNYIGNHAVNATTDYKEIYWRIDLSTQTGWQGGGADKLTRATTLANSNWAQGMIAHLWSAGTNSEFLAMDPASGIDTDGNLVSTTYNDFENLRWLGAKLGNIDLFSTENSGKWFCIEAHAKINTFDSNDGILEFWINDTLQAGSYDLNWHSNWNDDSLNYYINAIFIENYWNAGSPVVQERYLDNFVISTNRIGCKCESTTSVNEIETTPFVNVFPNPTNNYLNFQVERSIAMNGYKLEIIDSFGKSILTTEIINKVTYAHNLNDYPPGNYFYRLFSNSAQIKAGKFIVQKN